MFLLKKNLKVAHVYEPVTKIFAYILQNIILITEKLNPNTEEILCLIEP